MAVAKHSRVGSLLNWEDIQGGVGRVHVKCHFSFFSEDSVRLEYLQTPVPGTLNGFLVERDVALTVVLFSRGPVKICA